MKKLIIIFLAIAVLFTFYWYSGYRQHKNDDLPIQNGRDSSDLTEIEAMDNDVIGEGREQDVPDFSIDTKKDEKPPEDLAEEMAATGSASMPVEEVHDQLEEERNESSAQVKKSVLLDVPFISQAPKADWKDERQQDGCEEASVIMAIRWIKGGKLSKDEAEKKIIEISDWESENYGNFHDTSAKDTLERIIKGYFKYESARVSYGISANSIRAELARGNLVLVPANGIKLNNPNFTPPGPDRHMLVIKGYDLDSGEFITNDPGTRKGEGYRYKEEIIMGAITDYPTGDHLQMTGEEEKAMIVVER